MNFKFVQIIREIKHASPLFNGNDDRLWSQTVLMSAAKRTSSTYKIKISLKA